MFYLKLFPHFSQVITHGQDGIMAQVAELLLDVESLFNIYTREAVCLNVPGKGIKKPEPEVDRVDETTTLPVNEEEEEEAGEPKIEVNDLKPAVKSIVANLVTKSVSSGPVEDENLIEKVTTELVPRIEESLRRKRQSGNLSDEVLTEETKSDLRPVIIEEIHNHRLDLYKKEVLKDWPSKVSS